ncbi:helix-turn-helix transcriptional regulator [Halomonas sp. ATBC28]|jgi:AraC-like DNA-binding protein|nr:MULTISPECIES: helix-turn-helix transcriptional regulator [Halomonas]TMU17668.1 helix-turn-helix transcriptional regulator [Halomonas sp. ATBC28]CAD5250905.1 Helix-turn-helix, AraC type, DNA binding protein [Halomonas sp. 113]CAD5250940.1 Helix-turn-helix, AraC type, DNA binding protein [Halomonas sp. 59]CAD5257606.1 Helix-turn-helix, AraC type, DNA binding protein [Halomonas sp. I3]CAD5297169.1 Helix-turn-helix, AraC type, DNA binding protein [Halomonas sp. 156]CDG54272.1 Transcriptional r|tara:strand:+ start:5551 stop:6324 length:774 start_codon:yes stop_codon:yes gene_type:complete
MSLPSDIAFILDPARPVLTHARSMQAETGVLPHAHPRGQLLWAKQGVLRVTSEQAVWVVPSTHGVWIPGNCNHQVSCETLVETRNLYIDPTYPVRDQDTQVVMVAMTALMREIVLRLNDSPKCSGDASTARLGLVAIDELNSLSAADLSLPAGTDPRLRRIISHMVSHPDTRHILGELASLAGASVRTLERLFKSETGLTFRQWRTRFKLMNALEALDRGESSTAVAYTVGYKSTSSFVAAFKAEFGYTPQVHARRL